VDSIWRSILCGRHQRRPRIALAQFPARGLNVGFSAAVVLPFDETAGGRIRTPSQNCHSAEGSGGPMLQELEWANVPTDAWSHIALLV
jgi:hypothetical protein